MQKNLLEYPPGPTTFRSQHRFRVAGPVGATGGGQVLKARARPIERFQNAGPIERDSFRELRHSDRKANESLLLRLKFQVLEFWVRDFHARDLGLFWQAE